MPSAAQIQQMLARQQMNADGLLSFKAGRMDYNPSTRMVTAVDKRGKIKIDRDDMGIMHFQWINRMNKQMKLDLMLFPSTMDWRRVDDCKDGRVYVLIDKNSKNKHFFWMQEPKEEGDEEIVKKMKLAVEGKDPSRDPEPAAAAAASSGATAPATGAQAAAPSAADNQAQLLQMFMGGGGTGSSTAPATGSGAQGGMNAMLTQAMMAALGGTVPEMKAPEGPDMLDVLEPSAVMKIFEDEEVANALLPLLPEGMRSKEDLRSQLEGPQFQATCRRLQSIINSSEMSALMAQMGLPSDGTQIGMKAFLEAIQKKGNEEREEKDKK